MGNRGPAQKPTPLRVLHGDRKDRINDQAPVPAAEDVARPEWLPDRAAAVWDRLAPDLIAKGVLTTWDVDAFADFCAAVVINQDAMINLDENGTSCTTPVRELADGTVIYALRKNPAWQVARESSALIVTLGGRFGLTPSDRAQLKVGGQEKPGGAERLLS